MHTRQLRTSDGHEITADISVPADAHAGVVVCHPHPLYGGDRFHPVVAAVFSRLPATGIAALRFDFRAEHGGGETEPLDVLAALDELAASVDGPLALAGYSFGAAMALRTDDPRVTAMALIAPPLGLLRAPAPSVPTLVLAPRHDQITDLSLTREVVEDWPHATLEIVESADHFLAGHTDDVADRAVVWLAATMGRR